MKLFFLLTAMAVLLGAQSNTNQFEVASIRPADPAATGTRFQVRPGIFRVTNATLRQMVAVAFDVRDFQVSGGDGWMGTDRFDINGKMNEPELDTAKMTPEESLATRKRMEERFQNLLIERFHLKVRRETREQTVYALTLAKTGSKMTEITDPTKSGLSFRGSNGRMSADAAGTTMDFLARSLANLVGRPVIDRTGLTAKYQFKAEWTQDMGNANAADAGPDQGPTLFTALQEQLGLRLESTRAPAEVLVIERAERPSEN